MKNVHCIIVTMEEVRVKRFMNTAIMPTRATSDSIRYDLYSTYDYLINPKQKRLCSTDLAFQVPPGLYLRIAGKSYLAMNNFIGTMAGVCDPSYRGIVHVILVNHGDVPYQVYILFCVRAHLNNHD